MNEICRSPRFRWAGLAAFLAAALMGGVLPAAAQEAPVTASLTAGAPLFYLHLSGRLAGDFMSCPSINDLVAPLKGGGFGLNVAGGLRAGFRNIVQIEYRAEISFLHDFTWSGGDTNIEMTVSAPQMFLAKFNPLFWTGDPATAWFLVLGLGRNAKYADKNDDGWKKGDMTVFGLEYDKITRNLEAGASLEYRSISYGQIEMPAFPAAVSPYKAGFIVAAIHFGIGLGF